MGVVILEDGTSVSTAQDFVDKIESEYQLSQIKKIGAGGQSMLFLST